MGMFREYYGVSDGGSKGAILIVIALVAVCILAVGIVLAFAR